MQPNFSQCPAANSPAQSPWILHSIHNQLPDSDRPLCRYSLLSLCAWAYTDPQLIYKGWNEKGAEGTLVGHCNRATGKPTQGIIPYGLCFPHRRFLPICSNCFLIEKNPFACHVPSLCLIGKSHLMSMPNSITSVSWWLPRVLLSELREQLGIQMSREGPMEDPSRRGSTRENLSWAREEGQAVWEAYNNGKSSGVQAFPWPEPVLRWRNRGPVKGEERDLATSAESREQVPHPQSVGSFSGLLTGKALAQMDTQHFFPENYFWREGRTWS